MKQYGLLLVALMGLSSLTLAQTQYHSFLPGQIWKDDKGVHINAHGGGILYQKGTYYWYGEHKIGGDAGNQARVGVHCYSSKDLYNWKDEGIALKVDPKEGSKLEIGCIIERPKVIYNARTRKYVMWFHYEQKGHGYDRAASGVALSAKATGPFKLLKIFRPDAGTWPLNVLSMHKSTPFNAMGAKFNGGYCSNDVDSVNFVKRDFEGGQMARDMNLFVDTDGKAYLIYSSEENSTLHISLLTPDYLSTSGKWVRVFPGKHNEGAALFKRKGKYYLFTSACTGWAPNPGRSAMASHIFGPWKELGNPCTDKDSLTTYHSQSTFVIPVAGKKDAFIFMGDRWSPKDAIDGRYIWLPIEFKGDKPILRWRDEWTLDVF